MIYRQNTSTLQRFIAISAWCFGLFLATTLPTYAATMSVSPQTGVYTVGGVFTAQVRINTESQAINASEGTLKFDSQKLSVVSVAKGSIFSLWTVEPTFSNSAGTVTFGGGSPAGYTGTSGSILTVTFRSKAAGTANVSFSSGSVLAADGRGTNVLRSMGSAAFTIASAQEAAPQPEVIEYVAPANTPAAPSVRSSTHPDPTGWYTNKTAELSWTIPEGVTAVRTLLDTNAGSVPTKLYETPIDSISISDLEEGVSYFHIQFKNKEGWGKVTHYRLAVDTIKPATFTITHPDTADYSAPNQTLQLEATDDGSGIARYIVQIDGGEPYEYIDETASSTITLPALEPGHHSVIIEAFDYANNSIIATYSFAVLAFDKPQFTEYPSQITSEVIPVIKGITRPLSEVTVTVRRIDESTEPQVYTLPTAADGIFTLIPNSRFSNGVYELTAVAVDQHGAKSESSDPIRIAVQDPGYLHIGSLIVSVLSVIVPMIALILLLILLVLYFIRRFRIIKGGVVRETKEALEVLNREFAHLEEILTNEQTALEQSRKTKKLTKAEETLVESMRSGMKTSRSRVAKEISDVDDIVT